MSELDHKQEQIIETALKRFAHFGINKTTMSEIADDLSSSKASLYYYFPDKASLILAVIKHLLKIYHEEITKHFRKADSVKEGLYSIIDIRNHFAKKYFMLHLGSEGLQDITVNEQAIKTILREAEQTEITLLAELLEKDMAKGIARERDARATAQTAIDMLIGLHLSSIVKKGRRIIPDESHFDELTKQQKFASDLLIEGINK